MSCIPSLLNGERDSFPMENAEGRQRGPGSAEGLRTAALAREFRRQRKRNIVSLTKEAVIMTEDSQVRIRHCGLNVQYSIHSSWRNELLSPKHKTKNLVPSEKSLMCVKVYVTALLITSLEVSERTYLLFCGWIAETFNSLYKMVNRTLFPHTPTHTETGMLCYLNSTKNWLNATEKVTFMEKSLLCRALLQLCKIWL